MAGKIQAGANRAAAAGSQAINTALIQGGLTATIPRSPPPGPASAPPNSTSRAPCCARRSPG